MSSAKPKPVAEINLEEFERRLRASVSPQANVEDPLAELTRLVDTIGFERSPSERALELSRPRAAPKPDLRLASPPAAPKPAPEIVKAPTARVEPPQTPAPLPPLEDTTPALRPSFDAVHVDSLAFEPLAPALADTEAAVELAPEPIAPRSPRGPGWGLKVGGLIAAAAVMVGAVVVFKVGGQTHSGPPPLILASTTPTKVAPPSEATVRTANETGALLTRDSAQPTPTPPKLVNPPEAPLDLAARWAKPHRLAVRSRSCNHDPGRVARRHSGIRGFARRAFEQYADRGDDGSERHTAVAGRRRSEPRQDDLRAAGRHDYLARLRIPDSAEVGALGAADPDPPR